MALLPALSLPMPTDPPLSELTSLLTLCLLLLATYHLVSAAVGAVAHSASLWTDAVLFMDLATTPTCTATAQSLLACGALSPGGPSLLIRFGAALRAEAPQLAPPLWSLATLVLYACYVSTAALAALGVSLFATLSLVVALAVKWRLVANLVINSL